MLLLSTSGVDVVLRGEGRELLWRCESAPDPFWADGDEVPGGDCEPGNSNDLSASDDVRPL